MKKAVVVTEFVSEGSDGGAAVMVLIEFVSKESYGRYRV